MLDSTVRAFVALFPPPPVLARIREVQAQLENHVGNDGMRWTAPDQLHLTLRFLGNVAAPAVPVLIDALRTACLEVSPFVLRTAGCGVFPNRERPRVLWLGLGGDVAQLRQLAGNVHAQVAGFGDHTESRDFHSHVTLARIRPDARCSTAISNALAGFTVPVLPDWRVAEMSLVQSRLGAKGAGYSTLASLPLQ